MAVSPGAPLRWNGAIHTEGSLLASDGFVAYMVSSPNSCVYSEESSVIEVSGEVDNDNDDNPDFQGQLISGVVSQSEGNSFTSGAVFHTDSTAKDDPDFTTGVETLTADKDTVSPTNSGSAADIMQDPIEIFTRDKFVHIDDSNAEDKWTREAGSISRVVNDDAGSARPFLDDGYRADNRYGPKPLYNSKNGLSIKNGVKLTGSAAHKSGDKITDNNLLITNTPDTEDYGLDGYWERSAAAKGLRVVVGQRLELGNMFGWGGNNDPLYPPNSSFEEMTDRNPSVSNILPTGNFGKVLKGSGETLQLRSLRDNLAAVQSMAVYHSLDANGGTYPLACIASTVHPGTQLTLENSRTFEKYPDGTWKTDFLTGNGTNGLEFSPPIKTDFGPSTGAIATKWSAPLKNLAYFAGDPKGGAPSFPAIQGQEDSAGGVVHPYPYMSMWGDFSILRRIFTDYSSSDPLSIADQSTIHTAACTLGMLAHNMSATESAKDYVFNNLNFSNISTKLVGLIDGDKIENGQPIIGRPVSGTSQYKAKGLCKSTQLLPPDYTNPNWTGCPSKHPNTVNPLDITNPEHPQNYYSRFSYDEWIDALKGTNPGLDANEVASLKILKESTQILRDRTLGFSSGPFTGDLSGNFNKSTGIWTNPASGIDKVTNGAIQANDTYKLGCDPRLFANGSLSVANAASKRLGLALMLCSTDTKPKYPALYYIFPLFDHSQLGANDSGIDHTQPATTEDFFSEGGSYINIVNGAAKIYKAVDVSEIALVPHAPTDAEWRTPVRLVTTAADFSFSGGPTFASTVAYNASANQSPVNVAKNLSQNIIGVQESSGYKFYRTALLDKAMMDGREQLSVRLLDLDIDLLTNVDASASTTDTDADLEVGGVAWIPDTTGIFYAFREDAVREDSIVRPYSKTLSSTPATAWSSCNTVKTLTTEAKCYMSLNPSAPHDPPLNNETGISPKPVDMFPDPARRPYGFRLINGKSLNRPDTTTDSVVAGMTFVTDNTVYIKGDFNLHAEKDAADLEANLIEEFKNTPGNTGNLLGTAFADETDEAEARKLFYGRDNLDDRFARPNEDNWRPVEVFADSITILSDIFLDGWVEDYFATKSTAANENDRGKPTKNSSYLNANRPWFTDAASYPSDKWQHEGASLSTPIKIDRNAKVRSKDAAGTFQVFPGVSGARNLSFYVKENSAPLARSRQVQQPSPYVGTATAPVRVNALLIGGIVPAREGQSYGGLHNFPRILEYWAGASSTDPSKKLVISGGFFQLNFSTQGVAPWDQDAWEPGTDATPGTDTQLMPGGSNVKSSNFYYGAAQRIWGYDVAFQYSPAGPIARRFVQVGRPRSEFYRELPVDDPYINKLCASAGGGC